MVGMGTTVTQDPLPFTTYMSRLGQSSEGSVLINRVGLTRTAKRTDSEIDEVEEFYKSLYSPLGGPLHKQINATKWFQADFASFDQHRANQERKRPIGSFLG